MKHIQTILISVITLGVGIIAYFQMTESRECETFGHASERLADWDANRAIHTHRYLKN